MWLEMVQLGLNVFALECTSWSTELDFQPSLKHINYFCRKFKHHIIMGRICLAVPSYLKD